MEKNDNRERILDCAKQLFYLKGYDAVGVQEIANAAGITKPTLYYYFKSKQGLLQTLLEVQCGKLIDELQCQLYRNQGLYNKLYEVTATLLHLTYEDKEFYFLMVSLFYSAKENEAYQTVRPFFRRFISIMEQIFVDCESELGAERVGKKRLYAGSFIGILNQYFTMRYMSDSYEVRLCEEEIIHGLVHQFMHGMY